MLPEQMQKFNGGRAKKRETKPKWKEKGSGKKKGGLTKRCVS